MPEYIIKLDPRNPGHFLACCGLFELADLASPGAVAYFTENARCLHLATDAALPPALALGPAEALNGKPYEKGLAQVELLVNGKTPFVLNWWLTDDLMGKTWFKSWAGPQDPHSMLAELISKLKITGSINEVLQQQCYSKTRFGIDSTTAWDALDVGYSPNEIDQSSITYPWIEVLGVVGLQGFRPRLNGKHFCYSAWLSPLGVVASRASVSANGTGIPTIGYRFVIASRGKAYKTFLRAKETT